jgi:hypothetical protein
MKPDDKINGKEMRQKKAPMAKTIPL